MKNLRKHIFRDIKNSFGRFMSILLISALGVAFFTGVMASPQSMKESADKYYDDYQLMDIRILSTLGLTDNDVAALKAVEGVEGVYPTYAQDVLMQNDNMELVLKIHALPSEIDESDVNYLNRPHLVEGRLPESKNEVVVEADSGFDSLPIGASITLTSGTDTPLEDTLENTTYTIVGRVQTPYYLSLDKGSSPIGSGQVNAFIMISEENFKSDVYTEIYVSATQAKALKTYGQSYDELILPLVEKLETVGMTQAKVRYDEVKSEIKQTLDENLADYEAGKKEADTEFEKVEAELEEAQQALTTGQTELDASRQEFETYIESVQVELNAKQQELATGEKTANDAYDTFMAAKPEALAEIEKLEATISPLEQKITQLTQQVETLQQQIEDETLTPEQLAALTLELETAKATKQTLDETLIATQAGVQTGKDELAKAEQQLIDAKAAIKTGQSALTTAKQQLETEQANARSQFDQAQAELNTGQKELESGKLEYKANKEEVEAELADAKAQLDEGYEQLDAIEMPEWFVLDRNKHYSYVDYENAALSIEAISQVFPVFFFAVAALVCLTTMTRMVDENRLNIGTLKGLGYSNFSIASKFLIYAGLASVLGGLLGAVVGFNVFPNVVMDAYAMLYTLPEKVITINLTLAAVAIVVATLVTTLSAYSAVNHELKETPSLLMRPKAPKSGKRILIERIPFIWNNLSFIGKVTVRNIFRYKKRFFMTVIGISGCTALLLAGFGIKDSIRTISDKQFGEIYLYDVSIGLSNEISDENKEALNTYLSTDDNIKAFEFMGSANATIVTDEIEQAVSLVVPQDLSSFNDVIILRDRISKEPVELLDNGVILSEKLASSLEITVGDTITFEYDEKLVELNVSGITEQYVNHYVYMSPAYYEKVFEESVAYNTITADLDSLEAEDELASELMTFEDVKSVMLISTFKDSFNDTINSLNYVVLLMIVSAGALAFVVLYNLTNVNISERMREIATIKVLGFYDKEVSSYIYRENIILTLIGTAVGLGLGVILHRFIMLTVELDNMMFGREMETMSFIYAMMLTLMFALLVNLAMIPKLKNVQMVESLKSVD